MSAPDYDYSGIFVYERKDPITLQRVPLQRVDEPTGQHAIVADAAGHIFVRLEHRWYQAGGATVEPILWSEIHAVVVKSYGDPS